MGLSHIAVAVAAASLTASAPSAQAQSADKWKIPAAVRQAVETNRPGAEIDKLTVEKENGIRFYDFEFKNLQGEMDVAEDGTVLDIATVIEMKDVPEAAATAIRAAAKGKTIKQLQRSEVRAEIVKEGGRAHVAKLSPFKYVYEAELAKGEVEVTAEGKILKIEK